ncbi:hypothetical protein N431DRAFT_484197 [Stipitochalara longipes BDJ]|nr:hypothetical protein N431DRAFT_484197 [Stipitochalara longipes BDJ]
MEIGTTESHSSDVASISCFSCRERKQKCDKALPGCSRCGRLLLKCHYPKPANPPSPPLSSTGSYGTLDSNGDEVINDTDALIQGLASAASQSQAYHGQLFNLLHKHEQNFDEMVELFFSSYHKWVPIVHQDSFREYRNTTRTDISRGHTALVLSMCLLTRPFKDGDLQDSLRVALHKASRRLFWDPESMAQPTLPFIQSGVLLSSYEHGQGSSDAAYMTICTCLSMAQVLGLSKEPLSHEKMQPPLPGIWTTQLEGPRTWWAMLIHERMISLNNGALIRPLNMRVPDNFEVALGREINDPLSISFYYEVRAATFLDQVLDFIRNNTTTPSKNWLGFQALDRSLLNFLKSLIEQYLGSCCEAVAVGVSAFIHLHQWRLTSTDPVFSAQDRLESCDAIETVMKIIAATAQNGAQNFPCHSQYSVQLIYQLLISIRYLEKNGRSHLENWAKVLVMMLEHQQSRWKIAGDYLANLAAN